MNKLSKRHFWEWFKRNHQEYLSLKNKTKKEQTYWLNEMNAHLRAYFKFLYYSIEWRLGENVRLTISVHGKSRHFRKVDDLVAKAPVIPGWDIMALEAPRPVDFLLEPMIIETGIDPRDLYFVFDDGMLTIYHRLFTEDNAHSFYQMANAAVYNLVGERSFGEDIRDLEVTNVSGADRENLKPLEELPECLDGCSSMMIDSEGNLVVS